MRVSKALWRFGLTGLVVLVAVLGSPTLPAHAQGGTITGQVASPGGYPLPAGTVVKLFEPGSETVRGQAVPDPGDGTFSLGPVPNGLYVLRAVPPEGSGYTQSLPKAVSVAGAPVDVGVLALTTPQVSGTVVAPDGVTPTPAWVKVYLGDGQVLQVVHAPAGAFLIGGLPVGSYSLQAFPATDDPYWRSQLSGVSISDPGAVQTVTLTLRPADLWGVVQDSQGQPVAQATVVAAHASGRFHSDHSSASGFWAIGGLLTGTYQLAARPPWPHSGLFPTHPVTVTLPGAGNPYTLTFGAPPKLVTGTVTTNTGLPVVAAHIVARRVNQAGQAGALTRADGTYRLDLAPGLWALSVRPVRATVPAGWIYPQPPQLVYFHADNTPETRQQNFEVVIADAQVSGRVQMPDGSMPPFTVTVGLHSDEGVGVRGAIDPASGDFVLDVPNGGYKVIVDVADPGYLGPLVEPIHVPPGGSYDLETLTLLARSSLITGTITAGGVGVAGIPVAAWRPGATGSLRTLSGPDGLYALAVSEGEWHLQPAPTAAQPYVYTGSGADVSVAAESIVPDVDFRLLAADAIISGVLVDEHGRPVGDAEGWAAASSVVSPTLHNGAPIQSGVFSIYVPQGTYQVGAFLPAGSPYTPAAERRVTALAGQTTAVTMTVQVKNAVIAGALWDPRAQDVVEGVPGAVGAWSEGNWVAAPIETGNGAYRMGVAAGLWHLNYRIDPTAGYVKLGGAKNVPVQAGQTAVVPLPITARDGCISGSVLTPDGSPLAGATVLVKGVTGDVDGLWLQTRSRADGTFVLAVPSGRYRLGATVGGEDWIKPVEVVVNVPRNGVSAGHVLQFRAPDAVISGTLSVSNTLQAGQAGEVQVWAWSDDGGFTRGTFPVAPAGDPSALSGPYRLGVISNTTWHLGAVFETSTHYWLGRAQVTLGSGSAEQDLVLRGPFPKPAPVVVTFDAATPQRINLADGTHIYIPAGAMPVSGTVTLRVVPLAALPHQQHANVLTYGYAFLATTADGQPIEEHFNQDVVISFSYDEAALLQQHVHEQWLKPAYYSTTTERWTFPESYVVDTDANRVVMQIDHFTDFALTGSASYTVYLPLVGQ